MKRSDFPYLEFELPTSHYHQGEAIPVVMLLAKGGRFEVRLSPLPNDLKYNPFPHGNRFVINKPGLPPGEYFLKARWKSNSKFSFKWTSWSTHRCVSMCILRTWT